MARDESAARGDPHPPPVVVITRDHERVGGERRCLPESLQRERGGDVPGAHQQHALGAACGQGRGQSPSSTADGPTVPLC